MKTQTAIIVAGGLVAFAILLSQHWQITSSVNAVYRLNRWTGSVASCNISRTQRPALSSGIDLDC